MNKETLEQASFSLDLVQLAAALAPEQIGEGIEANREEKARITTILHTAES